MSQQEEKNSQSTPATRLALMSLPAANGVRWLQDALKLFAGAPLLWLAAGAMMFFGLLTISVILAAAAPPLVLLVSVPTTLLIAGAMYAARKQQAGEGFKIENLFYTLDHQLIPLTKVGLLYAVGSLVTAAVAELIFTGLGFQIPELQITDPTNFRIPLELWLLFLINLALLLPLVMAFWFAPGLVLFFNMPPVQAFRLSFVACKKNTIPFLIFGLYALGLIVGCIMAISLTGLIAIALTLMLTLVFYCAAFAVSVLTILTSFDDIFRIQQTDSQVIEHEKKNDESPEDDGNFIV